MCDLVFIEVKQAAYIFQNNDLTFYIVCSAISSFTVTSKNVLHLTCPVQYLRATLTHSSVLSLTRL